MNYSEHLSMHLDVSPSGAYRAFVGNLSHDDIRLLAEGLDHLNTPRAVAMARSMRFHAATLDAFITVSITNTTPDHEQ